ncbi:MalY/PatB family protein [Corynebacterium sp. sy039]|uniref:MalY/PatB family protein n=1 Tax=Corynebacterium sp. sy039 TaxID=2599641 RepID=UPI0011B6DDC5|nr:aminotransferase class I/II-fold pyridoxal phosphate-dependent enzyme [Corynebacterium sp. sy039]QDZ43032.1 aminotransferase class I/II-fold pyridoxal phosphate-dependent enzyme [Corynebacterium sp. sy039]
MLFPSYAELKNRRTLKWTRYPDDVIPLWVAESDFSTCPAITEALARAVEHESFGYPPDNAGIAAATAQFYQDHYGYPARPEWIFPVPDVVRALCIAIEHFTRKDSTVIIPVPAYPPFFQLLSTTNREGVFLDARDGIDLAEVEAAFQQGAGAIVLCNPFNPLGFVFKQDYLIKLCDLAARYDARVLVDEIHAPLVYEGTHIVAAGVSDTAARVCITATATSKAWNTAGLKCAQLIFSNAEDVRTWNALSPIVKDGVSTFGLIAAEAAYTHGREFLAEELAYLDANRRFLVEELPRRFPGIKLCAPAATYLLWLDFSDTVVPGNPSEFFLEKAKVMLNDGEWFGELGKNCVRLNFATSREILDRALSRMEEAVQAL